MFVSLVDAFDQLGDGLGLIAHRLEFRDELETGHGIASFPLPYRLLLLRTREETAGRCGRIIPKAGQVDKSPHIG